MAREIPKLLLLTLAGWAIGIVTAVGFGTLVKSCIPVEVNEGVKETFDELEFVVIHRPHLTYFMDVKYLLCFATRKPDYQDLVQFHCPERMWKEVEESLKGKVKVKPAGKVAKDGGSK